MLRKVSLFLLLGFSSIEACEEYFVVFLVNARQLDNSCTKNFLKSVAKHPSDGSKNGDVGHAWIYLHGDEIVEGGHSGEFGIDQPRYMEGVMDNIALGAKNPASYLWVSQSDGCFQEGNGGHLPTFAAKVPLTQAQYLEICAFIQNYPFHDYCLTTRQCCTFVREIGKIAGVHLEDQATLKLDACLSIGNTTYKFWEDPCYEYLTYGSPDQMESSLKSLVAHGQAENVTKWYRETHQPCLQCRFKQTLTTIWNFPLRLFRYLQIN